MARPNTRPYKVEVIAPAADGEPGGFELVPIMGSDISSRNAAKHGINSDSILPGEAHAFYSHARGVFDSFQPVGQVESFLTARVATLMWRLNRVIQYESAEIAQALKRSASRQLQRLDELNEDIGLEIKALHSGLDEDARQTTEEYIATARQERDSLLDQLGQLERLALLPEAVTRKIPRYEGALSRSLSTAINDLRRIQADRTRD